MTRSPARILKRLSLCSSLAIATSLVLGPSPATAQLVGTIDSSAGIDAINSSNSNLIITGQQAVINWTATNTPGGGQITFLPDGSNVSFTGASDFAVLNRVTPGTAGNAIYMGGNINSLVGDSVGGTVYFYSPNGIVIGANASINVGSLGLTTSPITDVGGNWMTGFGTASPSVTFGAANAGSYVRTNSAIDGSINANGVGNYVALVAPIVQHNGVIRTDSGAALVAAEAATITFNQSGLYDIEVITGTDALQPLTVNGGTITRNSQTIGGDRHAYLVAVPKNDAITLLVVGGAQLGFDIAGSAGVEGNTVVLSAGRDVTLGSVGGAPVSAGAADITIDNAAIGSNLFASASNIVQITTWNGATTFTGNVDAHADTMVAIQSTANSLTIGGDLFADADYIASGEGEDALAGEVRLGAHSGTTLSIVGGVTLSAVAEGGSSSTAGIASGNAQGGIVSAYATDGGTLSIGGALVADASGRGGNFSTIDGFIDGGNGLGGTVDVFAAGDSTMIVTGAASLAANGIAGQANDCSQCGGIGGIGDAGRVTVQARTDIDPEFDNILTFGNGLTINANGLGGSGQSGGLGTGGTVIVSSRDQSTLTVTGDLSISAEGRGGNASGLGGIVGDGGEGRGGDVDVAADNGSLAIAGNMEQSVDGTGGTSEIGNGGYGEAGIGELFALNGGSVAVGFYSSIQANGTGGDGLLSGGEGQGGFAYFSANSGGTVSMGSYASFLVADGVGGDAFNVDNGGLGNGGLGEGGHVEAYANNATVEFEGALIMSADGEGGSAGDGMTAGDSQGGDVWLQALNGGGLTVAGGLYASAVGIGDYINLATISGNGTGGTINIYSRDGDSTLTVSGPADLNADGAANTQGECSPFCGGIGGIGQGGDIIIASQGATGIGGNLLTFGNALTATANGFGGSGIGGAAGDGFGGDVLLNAADGNRTNIAGNVRLEARGSGGFDDFGLAGGDGTGGLARITTSGTGANLLTLGANVVVDASGLGGDSELGSGGTGGNGQSGRTRVVSNGGAIAVTGNLTLRSISSGGSGDNGGDGLAFIGTNPINTATSDARLLAYGGSVTVTGLTTIDVSASGGSGSDGGSGGDASGGYAAIHARNSNVGPSTITLGTVIVDAEATGGAGGAGTSGNQGTPGGDGGAATGGFVVVTAAAGNGHLNAGNVFISASADGGAGGDGGNGDNLAGGSGGDGGNATGGTIFAGAETGLGEATASNTGTATFGNIIALASATGGNGGFGNFGTPGGDGGAGGSGDGGLATFQTRGALVNAGAVTLTANGTGGDGGGSETGIGGMGGDGFAGEVQVIATSRSLSPAQRGTLNADAIFGNAIGTGGSGSTPGASLVEGGSVFQVENADANFGQVDILVDGGAVSPGSDESRISLINAAVNITGGGDFFAFQTLGDLSLYLSSSSLTAGNFILNAGDFVLDGINPAPGNPGTVFANTAFITTGNNFIADVNIDTVNDLTITAGGLIQFDRAISGGGISLWAQGGSITIAGVDAGAALTLLAGTSVDTSDIAAGTSIDIIAGGAITLGNLVAGTYIDILGGGDFVLGSATAGEYIDLQTTGGNLTGGDMTAGDTVEGNASGSVNYGAISAGIVNPSVAPGATYSVGLLAGTSITTGSIDAAGRVIVAAPGTLTTGDVNAGRFVLAMVSGDMSFGSITAGATEHVFLGSYQMLQDGGGVDNFDPNLVFVNSPLTTDGSITIGGPILAGSFEAVAGTFLAAGDISVTNNIDILTNTGGITLGNLVAGVSNNPNTDKAIHLDAQTTLMLGNAVAVGEIDLEAEGGINGGDLTSGARISASGDAAIVLGDLSGGLINPQGPTSDGFSVTASSATSVSVGDVEGAEGVGFATLGALTTGDIAAGTDFLAMVGGNMNFGAITAGAAGRVYLADVSMFFLAGGPDNFVPSQVFGAPPVASAGAITINGPVSTGSFQAAGASITTGNITTGNFIQIITSTGDMALGNLLAGLDPIDGDAVGLESGGSILVGDITALGGIDFDAAGSVTGLNFTTGSELGGGAAGALSLGNISAGLVNPQGPVADGFSVELSSGTSISVGSIAGSEGVALATPGALTTGNITAGTDFLALAGGNMSFGAITAIGRTYLADYSMFALSQTGEDFDPAPIFAAAPVASAGSIAISGPVSTGSFQAAAASISVGDINAASFIEMFASGSVSFGTLVAGTYVTIDPTDIVGGDVTALAGDVNLTGDSINIGNVSASDNVFLTALAGDLATGNIDAGINVTLDASGDLTTGNITAGGLIDATGASLTLGNLSANSIALTTTVADLTVGNVTIPGSLMLTTAGDLVFGDLNAFDVDLAATGSITGGNIDSDTDITASAGAGITFLDLEAGGFDNFEGFRDGSVDLTAGGDVETGGITAEGAVTIDAGGSIGTLAIDARDAVDMDAVGDITAGDITGASIDLFAGGDIATGDLTTQFLTQFGGEFTALLFPGASVTLESGGDISTDNIDSFDGVHADAGGGIATGTIDAVDFVQLLGGGNVATGAIFAGSFIDVFSSGGGIATGGLTGTDIDLEADDAVTIAGAVSAQTVQATAGAGLTTLAITAQTIDASAGGTATLDGVWSANNVTLASNDIDVGTSGGITVASSGILTLISTNATQALIGDGLTGAGYALSNAEFGRIEGGSVYILARGDATAAQDMLIGDLTVTGPTAGSTIESNDGILVLATGDIDSETPGGVIRVVGDVIATGFGGGNAIEFYADMFELDAATGGISITSSGGALSGELGLYAEQIHVAQGSILDQLAVNPQYAGYQDDLNAPAAVQRPEGVLNAATFWIESDNLRNILIQNMGTEETPAGFLAQEIFVNDDDDIAGPPGSIDLVVNGQLQTEVGTLTGIAVRDALVEGENLTPFTGNSTINGCELVGDCSDGPIDGPVFPLPTEFSLIIDAGLPELPFDGDETSSAIQPPPALFDTRPLDPDATVDEPISGSGNPGLIGSDGDEQCAAAGNEQNRQCTPAPTSGGQQ